MSETATVDDEILDGVYCALCNHGYADLTMQDIADECDKSTALLHYHYDTKDDLLVAFLDGIITDYEQRLAGETERSPEQRLVTFLARFVFEPSEGHRESFHLALLEMRSQGPFDERVRDRLERSDTVLRETAAEILRAGVETGVFDPVDPDRTAALLVAALDGARTRQITLGDGQPEGSYTRVVVEELLAEVVDPLLGAGADRPTLDTVLGNLERDEESS